MQNLTLADFGAIISMSVLVFFAMKTFALLKFVNKGVRNSTRKYDRVMFHTYDSLPMAKADWYRHFPHLEINEIVRIKHTLRGMTSYYILYTEKPVNKI